MAELLRDPVNLKILKKGLLQRLKIQMQMPTVTPALAIDPKQMQLKQRQIILKAHHKIQGPNKVVPGQIAVLSH